mmetsp:Transcript_33546/g.66303  ORF Transcript_33546/g.66303 Transcript_33546/m.66303 type:complete len:83 (-) Transcript_33546:119-367(-)
MPQRPKLIYIDSIKHLIQVSEGAFFIFASINNTHDEYYLDDHIDILPPKTAKTNKWERLILFYYQGHARRIRLRKTGDDITT